MAVLLCNSSGYRLLSPELLTISSASFENKVRLRKKLKTFRSPKSGLSIGSASSFFLFLNL